MNLQSILALLKGFIPVLEPLGENGVGQLFDALDKVIAGLPSQDERDIFSILSPALRQAALVELRKLK